MKNVVENNTAELVATLLAGAFPELALGGNFNGLKTAAAEFVTEWANHASQSRFLRNTAPKVPGDNQESVGKPYPDIEHPRLPVPDPAETETSKPSKVSIPAYGEFPEYDRWALAVQAVTNHGQQLWTAARFGGGVETDEMRDLRRAALDDVDEIRSGLYGF